MTAALDGEKYAAARLALDTLHRTNQKTFTRLFLLEREESLSRLTSEPLLAAGLIMRHGGRFRSQVRIWPHKRRFYASDPTTSQIADRVYPVYQDQGAFFAEHLAVQPGDRVLDIGTGSGVLALEAAQRATTVVAIDPNPRATAFARYNATLNGISNVSFMTVPFAEHADDERYDTILCNPPFTAVPEAGAWFNHGSAGSDGLDVVRRFLPLLPKAVTKRGRLQLLLNSLGSDSEIHAVGLLKEAFPRAGLEIQHLYNPPSIPIDVYARRFADAPGYWDWRGWLTARNFTRVFRMLITVDLAHPGQWREHVSPKFNFTVLEPFGEAPRFAGQQRPGGWEAMLMRYGARTTALAK